jgi:HlyD family secretion protein
VIRSPQAGRITEVKVVAGDVVAAGAALATIAPTEGKDTLLALLYVPATEGKRIEVGMPAEITPTTVERAVYGHIPGSVVSVAPLPATPEGMRRVLRNDQLVQQLIASGAPIEVRVALDRNIANASGFDWSASKGPDAQISAGSIVEGQVVVDRTPVIGWLIPAARN